MIDNNFFFAKYLLILAGFLWPKIAIAFPVQESISEGFEQVTFVNQIANVSSSDWSFQALQSLDERYNCLPELSAKNYSEQTTISRYEFAFQFQVCLEHLEQKILANNNVRKEDLLVLQRLQKDFKTELNNLSTSISNLEDSVATLEKNQFSTTTKLEGEVLFQLGDTFGPNADGDGQDDSQTFLGARVRLNFDTSFYGTDLLRTRLEARNIARLDNVTGTVMTRLGTDGENQDQSPVSINYRFAIGEKMQVIFGPTGVKESDIGVILNPLSSSGKGAVSRFGRRDPAIFRGPGGAGLGIQYQFNEYLQASVGYVASEGDASNTKRGFFNGSQSIISQLLIEPNDELALAFTYTHNYWRSGDVDVTGDTGSFNANRPFGKKATSAHNLGLQFNWRATDGFEWGGWFAYTQANQLKDGDNQATILNGALTFFFEDLFAKNNVGGIIIGVPPIVVANDLVKNKDEYTSLHIEALYRIEITDHIQVTPAVFLITRPNHEDNTPIWVGTIRSRFSF